MNRAVPRVASTRDIATSAPVIAAAATTSARPASPWSSAAGGLCPVFAFHASPSTFWTTRAARNAAPAPMILATMDWVCLSVTGASGCGDGVCDDRSPVRGPCAAQRRRRIAANDRGASDPHGSGR